MSSIIGACLALGCILFTLSLPLGGLPVAKTIRRWALFCFLAAFAPSVACSLATSAVGHGSAGTPSAGGVLAGIGLLAVASVVAYVILAVRGRIGAGAKSPADSWRDRRGYQSDTRNRQRYWDDED